MDAARNRKDHAPGAHGAPGDKARTFEWLERAPDTGAQGVLTGSRHPCCGPMAGPFDAMFRAKNYVAHCEQRVLQIVTAEEMAGADCAVARRWTRR